MEKIVAVIPTHYRKEVLFDILDDLYSQEGTGFNLKIIVVVDEADNNNANLIKEKYDNTHIVKGTGEWWYTKSMNEGFKYAIENLDPDFLLTMNDDTSVKKDYLANLLDSYHKVDGKCIMGSISFTMEKPHEVMFSGLRRVSNIWIKNKAHLKPFQKIDPKNLSNEIKETIVLPGRGMFIPREILTEVSYFDETTFKQYGSDMDFCRRAQKSGYAVYVAWSAHVFVHKEMTGSGTSYLDESFRDFINSFFSTTDRLHIPAKSKYLWRHEYRILWPFHMTIFILAAFKNHFIKKAG